MKLLDEIQKKQNNLISQGINNRSDFVKEHFMDSTSSRRSNSPS